MLTAEQVKERTQYIGGSDCAAVLGLSHWKTPLELWAEKTGQIEPEDISGRLQVRLGNKLEEEVAALFMEATGLTVRRVNETLIHPQHDFIRANIDRRIVGLPEILECKTTSVRNAKRWENDQAPAEYICQCMHYMAVTGAKKCHLAVLIGNEDFKYFAIDRDEDMIRQIVTKEVEFWTRYVLTKVMPPQITYKDGKVLQTLFPAAEKGKVVQLPDEANQLLESIEAMETDISALDRECDKLRNQIKAMVKDGETGQTDTWEVKWVNVVKKEYVVKANSYRVFKTINKQENN